MLRGGMTSPTGVFLEHFCNVGVAMDGSFPHRSIVNPIHLLAEARAGGQTRADHISVVCVFPSAVAPVLPNEYSLSRLPFWRSVIGANGTRLGPTLLATCSQLRRHLATPGRAA